MSRKRLLLDGEAVESLLAGNTLKRSIATAGGVEPLEIELIDELTPADVLDLASGKGSPAAGEIVRAEAIVQVHGREIPVAAFSCDCGSSHFFVFQVEGVSHVHTGCASCGVVFCPLGQCSEGE